MASISYKIDNSDDRFRKTKEYVSGFKVCQNRRMKHFKTIASQIPNRNCKSIFWKGNSVDMVLNI